MKNLTILVWAIRILAEGVETVVRARRTLDSALSPDPWRRPPWPAQGLPVQPGLSISSFLFPFEITRSTRCCRRHPRLRRNRHRSAKEWCHRRLCHHQ